MDATETYSGRLSCDGKGNLLAHEAKKVGEKIVTVNDDEGVPILDESGQAITVNVPIFKFGKNHGRPVFFEDGKYLFVGDGDLSHNQRHSHGGLVGVTATQHLDPDAPGYAGTKDHPTEGNEHHWDLFDDDAHKSGLKFHPDNVAPMMASHTEASTDE